MRPSSVAVGLHCDWLILFDHNSARVCISVPFSKENMACSFETFFSDFTVIKCVDSERTLKNHTKIVGTSHINDRASSDIISKGRKIFCIYKR